MNEQNLGVRLSGRTIAGAKSVSRRLRTTRAGRWLWTSSLEHQFRWRISGATRSMRVLVGYGVVDQDERDRTVARLVELFFALADGLCVERFVEAGAKEASASRRAATLPSVRSVVAFEANPFTFERFAAGHVDSGIEYLHHALSDSPGSLTFNVRRNARGRPIADGQGSLLERSTYVHGYVEGVEVDAVTLDRYFASRDDGEIGPARTAMWVDVEGASAQVLRGGRQFLDRVDVLIIEVEERPSWDGQEWLVDDVVDFLQTRGLVPVARDAQSRYQYNIVFVRHGLESSPAVSTALAEWRSSR